MKNKLFALLLCLALLFPCTGTAYAVSSVYTAAEVENLCGGIVAYKGYDGAQSWIDGELSGAAGSTAEFYIIALSQKDDYNFSSYERSLKSYLDTHEVYSATSREKYALALSASGSTDRYITDAANEAIGGMGLMSLVFGLHLLNNGYESRLYTIDSLIAEILGNRLSDGGWAVIGSNSDVDVTAMTIQALAPYYGYRSDVTNAVNAAVAILSNRQTESGGFKGMGVENCESAAQVLTALSDIGIDAQYDSRFIKNGNSVLDAILTYRNADGSFSHTGGGYNESATVQAFYAMTAYLRMCYGEGPLYVLDHARHISDSEKAKPGNNSDSVNYRNSDEDTDDRQYDTANDDRTDTGDPAVGSTGGSPASSASSSSEKPTEKTVSSETETQDHPNEEKPSTVSFQPTKNRAVTAATDETKPSGGGYKIYVIGGILLAAGAACGVLFLLKKRGKKHYITVAIIAAAGILFVLLTNFQSPDSYRDSASTDGELTVTMTIRCDTIKDLEKVNDRIPDDGVILAETTFSANQGDTVYDLLLNAHKLYSVPIDNRGAQGAAYIAGINYLYEFDYGALSGWMYRVNGEFPDVGCQSYALSDGDRIEWLYTTDIGHDL